MSLVITFIGKNGAVMAGDMREITFQGDKDSREGLEKELYTGMLTTDEELENRATELEVEIKIRDDKNKISQRDGILVGEVSSIERGLVQKRRVYASADNYAIIEIRGSEAKLTGKGKGSAFLVFGNNVTKEIANSCIKDHWKNGNLSDAVKVMILTMEIASKVSASVSKEYVLLQTASKIGLSGTVEEDIKSLINNSQ